jgi:hypothetical protein
MSSTRIRRHVKAPRPRGYSALVDADAVAKWKVPDGMTSNVEEFQNPDGRYIVTFDGAIDGNLIQIALLITEDATKKVESLRLFARPWPVVKLFREYMERNLRPDPVPDAIWALPASASGK